MTLGWASSESILSLILSALGDVLASLNLAQMAWLEDVLLQIPMGNSYKVLQGKQSKTNMSKYFKRS
jgi:hypothetical protein